MKIGSSCHGHCEKADAGDCEPGEVLAAGHGVLKASVLGLAG